MISPAITFTTIIESGEMISVVALLSYLIARSTIFNELLEHRPSKRTYLVLVVVFGLCSIYGMMSGIAFFTANVTIRDFGPIVAGLIGGPFLGIGVGVIGSAYRLALGGTNVITVATGPLVAGAIAGLIYSSTGNRLPTTRMAMV